MMAQCQVFLPKSKFSYHQQKNFEKQKLNFSSSALFHMKASVSLKCFLNDSRCQIYIKLTTFVFWPNLPKKYFHSQVEKVNITIYFCILELIGENKIQVNLTILALRINFSYKRNFLSRTEKSTPPLKSAHLIQQVQLKLRILIVLEQIY